MSRLRGLFKKTSAINETVMEQQLTGVIEKQEPSVPEGLWVKCPKCQKMIYKEDVRENSYVCPKCDGYFRIKTKTRIRMIADAGSFEEWGTEIADQNALQFPDYEEKLSDVRERTHLKEAITIGRAKIHGQETVLGVCDARFLMGSMGYVVGERIAAAVERATAEKLPVILYCCSGGARMQEGIVSLMQMAKTSAALKKHSDAGLLYIPVLTDPTTGGVTASFAMLGDIILAEPGALIGFAGPRVIAQTTGQKLPEGFQRAEFLLEKGIIDAIAERGEQKDLLGTLLVMHSKHKKTPEQTGNLVKKAEVTEETGDAWKRVQLSRSAERATGLDYINHLFSDFVELHGDRAFRDDGAIVGGIAMLNGMPVTVIAQQKGRNTKENLERNFGMPSPEGYRKALRLMKQAEKFGRSIINFVDTPGAACGLGAEERGQGEAIARNLFEMSALKTPSLSIMIGEGGSGGALALAVTDEVWMMENATYSILSPEGFATILWKDKSRAEEAATLMKMTSVELKELGMVERIIPEAEPVTPDNMEHVAEIMKTEISGFLQKQSSRTIEEIVETRYQRFRKM